MSYEQTYKNIKTLTPNIEHNYGTNVHIISTPYFLTLMNKISSPQTTQPLLTEYVKKAYFMLFGHICSNSFKTVSINSPTRMHSLHPEGIYQGDVIDDQSKVVSVDLARAGMVPSQIFYQEFNYLLNPENIRQDHFYAARKVNEANEVIGVDISGSKIGGPIDDAYVILPDPMGATGSTICHAIDHYKEKVEGNAKKYITAHLIITPEYIQNVHKYHPDVEIYALRLDRGLSSEKVLNSIPGTYFEEEKGLNEHQYIVPGAGGLGELLNNSFV